MDRFNFQTLRKKPTEWLTQRVLYGLIGIAVVVFALFYLVGYHQPFEENADFNAPLFTNLLLLLMGLLVVLSVMLSIVTIGRSLRLHRGKANGLENNVPVRRLWHTRSCGFIVCCGVFSINAHQWRALP